MSEAIFQELQIGKYYKVPCVRSIDFHPFKQGAWIPVLLPEHDDKAIIGAPWPHYHLDARFISAACYDFLCSNPYNSHFNQVVWRYALLVGKSGGWDMKDRVEDKSQPCYDLDLGIQYRRLSCKRIMPYDFPRVAWTTALEEAYCNSKMVNGRCPHKGVDLSQCHPVADVVTCPQHGLRFHIQTGQLVRTVAQTSP